jgi:tetratricopeptide (TPR) repeat protein
MKTSLRLMGAGLLVVAALVAQASDGRQPCRVRGEISPIVTGSASLTVELTATSAGVSQRTAVNPDGSFEFGSVQPGLYLLRILSMDGSQIHEETLTVTGPNQSLVIRLPESANAKQSSAEGSVSMRQLMHKVPTQARKVFDKGEQAEAKGDHEQALELLHQAVSIDPEFADAFNELGAVEAGQGDLSQAIDEFQKAVDLVPDHPRALANLSIVLAKAQRFDEAAQVARRALRIMPNSGVVRYVFATSLLFSKGDSDEVLDNLERSTTEIPVAHLLAAELLERRGKREEAIHHVEEYLKVVPANDKERGRAEAMLAELRQ